MKRLILPALLITLQGCATEIVHSDGSVTDKPVFGKKAEYSLKDICENGARYYIYTLENGKKGKVGPVENSGMCAPGETSAKE